MKFLYGDAESPASADTTRSAATLLHLARASRFPTNHRRIMSPERRSDWTLAAIAIAAAALFFTSLDRLWPLAPIDLTRDTAALTREARAVLVDNGIDTSGAVTATALSVHDEILDYIEREFGRDQAQVWIREGLPIYMYRIWFRTRGNPDTAAVTLHPVTGLLGWGRTVQDDAPGASLPEEAALTLARTALSRAVARPEMWSPAGSIERELIERRDHVFTWERWISRDPELRERVSVTISGDEITRVGRELILPEEARREMRKRAAPIAALQISSFLLMAVAVVIAFVVFLSRLRNGTARLAPAARIVAVIAACFLITQAMRQADLLIEWDPLWPRWIANFQTLGWMSAQGAWIMLVLFVVIAAGDALDRDGTPLRGEALRQILRGRIFNVGVGKASLRGFAIGLVCGAVLTLCLVALEASAGAWAAIQPRGFFFMALNSAAPTLATLLYFLMVALVEELSYRYFAGTLLLRRTGRVWIAIVVPALLYGASHTGLPFIPPVEPFWGRAIVFTAIGAVWGWAFLRYDALTVVFSHWAGDLFIFNWPRLASGDPVLVTKSILAISVPLLPGLAWAALGRTTRLAHGQS